MAPSVVVVCDVEGGVVCSWAVGEGQRKQAWVGTGSVSQAARSRCDAAYGRFADATWPSATCATVTESRRV